MSSLSKQSILAAIRGSFIGDAASLGTHWIYDPDQVKEQVPSLEAPEFKDPPTPAYYSENEFPGHYGKAGMLSPYGEQLLFVTTHVADNLDIITPAAMLKWAETNGGRSDTALKAFVNNMKASSDDADDDVVLLQPPGDVTDSEAHCFLKAVPITCLYAGQSTALAHQKVEAAIRVHQNNDRAVAFGLAASNMLVSILLGSSLKQALETCEERNEDAAVAACFDRAMDALQKKETLEQMVLDLNVKHHKAGSVDSPFYGHNSRSCELPGAFTVSLYLMMEASVKGPVTPATIEHVLRDNIMVGGDTCSRSILLGGILGASAGKVPEDWEANMDAATYVLVNEAAEKIAEHAVALK